MKNHKSYSRILAVAITAAFLSGCSAPAANSNIDSNLEIEDSNTDIVSFRPVDCGIQAQDLYEYPFIGLTASLTETMLKKITDREVFVFTMEDYTAENDISYAMLRFSSTTEEQREEEGMSVNIFSWETTLEKIGVIGVYQKELISQLNDLTSCDTHEKFGESKDGVYEYYISTNSNCALDLLEELKLTDLSISEMHDLDLNLGYTAFSADRIDGIDSIGTFTTEDVFGTTYTQDIFADHDLTLVNIFTTWCSPCVQEIPELEKMRQEYAEKDIKLGIVGIVLDIKTKNGIDEGALERAQTLYERSNAQFPFLIPDDNYLNGRLTGIESVPESFFVDKNGTIVSEPYIGANTQEKWKKIVDAEFTNLEANKK